jgi:hypothetical protein
VTDLAQIITKGVGPALEKAAAGVGEAIEGAVNVVGPVAGKVLGAVGGILLSPTSTQTPAQDIPTPADIAKKNQRAMQQADAKAQQASKEKPEACQACAGAKAGDEAADKPAKGKRTKNRLPEGKSEDDLGPPGGTLEKRNPQTGELQQIREYDANGQPVKDIDYGHDHTGAGNPHVHDWEFHSPQQPNPVRMPPRPPNPGEIP